MSTEDKKYEAGKTDKRGRILNPQTGKPLRDKDNRNYVGPFMGKDGSPNRKATAKLAARVKDYEENTDGGHTKGTGSHSPHLHHRPGSLQLH